MNEARRIALAEAARLLAQKLDLFQRRRRIPVPESRRHDLVAIGIAQICTLYGKHPGESRRRPVAREWIAVGHLEGGATRLRVPLGDVVDLEVEVAAVDRLLNGPKAPLVNAIATKTLQEVRTARRKLPKKGEESH